MDNFNNVPYNNVYGQGAYGQQAYVGNPMMPQQLQFPGEQNALTQEEIKNLKVTKPDKISITVPEREITRSMCTHHDGGDKTVPLNDGSGDIMCTICGARWNPDALDSEIVKNAVKITIAAYQSAKWCGDLNRSLVREFSPIIPLIEKIPELYDYSIKQLNKYSNQLSYADAGLTGLYAQYNNLTNTGTGFNPYYNQQFAQQQAMMMGGAYQQPYQPMAQQPYGMPTMPQYPQQFNNMSNPMAPVQQPMQQPVQQPVQQQPAAQPQQPAQQTYAPYGGGQVMSSDVSTVQPQNPTVTKDATVNVK